MGKYDFESSTTRGAVEKNDGVTQTPTIHKYGGIIDVYVGT